MSDGVINLGGGCGVDSMWPPVPGGGVIVWGDPAGPDPDPTAGPFVWGSGSTITPCPDKRLGHTAIRRGGRGVTGKVCAGRLCPVSPTPLPHSDPHFTVVHPPKNPIPYSFGDNSQ